MTRLSHSFATLTSQTRTARDLKRLLSTRCFPPDYGVNISRVNIPVDVAASFKCDVPSLSTLLGLVINDSFHPTSKLESKLPEGVFFGSLKRAASELPEIVNRYYGEIAPMGEASVALNTLLAQGGVLIYVPTWS